MKIYIELASQIGRVHNLRNNHNSQSITVHNDVNEFVKNKFPHGSGFDAGTYLDWDKSTSDKIVFACDFHHMDEHGYYDGWSKHTVTVTPSLQFGFNLKIGGRNRNDIKNYMAELFDHILNSEIPDYSISPYKGNLS